MNEILTQLGVIITCGPSYEPLDQVRRITNSSTGELGAILGGCFAEAGFHVLCLRGEGAKYRKDVPGIQNQTFTTNEDLISKIRDVEGKQRIVAFFHAAALCDFRVKSVASTSTQELSRGKISSRAGELCIHLEPAPKVIAELRSLFPSSMLVGWKYEVDESPAGVLEKGRTQITTNRTNACVVNGPAFGKGFGYLEGQREPEIFPSKSELSEFLVRRTKDYIKEFETAGTHRIR